jgi:hypothetical protein
MAVINEEFLAVLKDLRNWVRVATHLHVRKALEEALPDMKSRTAYQMFDGENSFDVIRVACKLSPNAVVALSTKCMALGLMETNADKKKIRLFDLNTFGLLSEKSSQSSRKANGD